MLYYKYPSRLSKSDTIRLIRLLPNADETAPIVCDLVNYDMSSRKNGAHRYECLSYVWGDQTDTFSIFIRDGESQSRFNVTQNLQEALLQLRDAAFERILWADMICINQSDMTERSQQVGIMARIYGCAHRVIVWLGKQSEDSSEALTGIRLAAGMSMELEETRRSKFTSRVNRKGEIIEPEEPSVPPGDESRSIRPDEVKESPESTLQKAVLRLLQRPWFRRIWVSSL